VEIEGNRAGCLALDGVPGIGRVRFRELPESQVIQHFHHPGHNQDWRVINPIGTKNQE
jgi:hypothetical protein